MEEETNKPLELPPPSDRLPEEAGPEPNQESFFRRALNRTREAIRNVDEAITGREAFRRINDRFERQAELNDSLADRLTDALEQVGGLRSRFDQEIETLSREAAEQRAAFERTAAEIGSTAAELRATATAAEKTLTEATSKNNELQKQAASQLARWNNDAETLKNEVRNLQTQVTQLQQSFKQFFITMAIVLSIMVIFLVYLLKFAR
jgi:chromosome segregation ATPase